MPGRLGSQDFEMGLEGCWDSSSQKRGHMSMKTYLSTKLKKKKKNGSYTNKKATVSKKSKRPQETEIIFFTNNLNSW